MADEVYAGISGLPYGALKATFSILDDLREAGSRPEDISFVEKLGIRLHQLQAVLGTVGANSLEARATRRAIRQSALEWMEQVQLGELA